MRGKKREAKRQREAESRFEWEIAVENGETNLTYEFWCLEKANKFVKESLHRMMFIDKDD